MYITYSYIYTQLPMHTKKYIHNIICAFNINYAKQKKEVCFCMFILIKMFFFCRATYTCQFMVFKPLNQLVGSAKRQKKKSHYSKYRLAHLNARVDRE